MKKDKSCSLYSDESHFNVMFRYFYEHDNNSLPTPISDVEGERISELSGDSDFAFIEPAANGFLSGFDRTHPVEMFREISRAGLQFIPVYGCYREWDNNPANFDLGVVVMNSGKDGSKLPKVEFDELAAGLCCKFGGDTYISTTMECALACFNRDGIEVPEAEADKTPLQNAFETMLESEGKLTSFEHPDAPVYRLFINPDAATLEERISRERRGEILFDGLDEDGLAERFPDDVLTWYYGSIANSNPPRKLTGRMFKDLVSRYFKNGIAMLTAVRNDTTPYEDIQNSKVLFQSLIRSRFRFVPLYVSMTGPENNTVFNMPVFMVSPENRKTREIELPKFNAFIDSLVDKYGDKCCIGRGNGTMDEVPNPVYDTDEAEIFDLMLLLLQSQVGDGDKFHTPDITGCAFALNCPPVTLNERIIRTGCGEIIPGRF